ncbi:hypothetical protein RF679_16540 [Undibacterium cyanobacteriorum]|uniref:Uncharacterized protein n=1 Tax=Undibacterium cyanobacteriorum TaxID=3073561 RepID=A0ABY9RHA2_9BURK|nr:hypothetical protein [Undibacterium sp. 20NA77.5]WMW80239.1 hypothetical protein RF679_16540 [Undibacterium sp. 20NA77.5]
MRIFSRFLVRTPYSKLAVFCGLSLLSFIAPASGQHPSKDDHRQQMCETSTLRFQLTADGARLDVVDRTSETVIESTEVKDHRHDPAQIAFLIHAAPRKSCVAVLQTGDEIWELSYADDREPVYQGYVHDYKMREGVPDARRYPARITILEKKFRWIRFDQHSFRYMSVTDDEGKTQIINLDIRRKMLDLHFSEEIDLTKSK